MNDLSPPIQLLPLGLTDWKFVGGGVGKEEGRGGFRNNAKSFYA